MEEVSSPKRSIIGLLSPRGKKDVKRWRQQEKTKQEALTTAFSQSSSNGGIEVIYQGSTDGGTALGGDHG